MRAPTTAPAAPHAAPEPRLTRRAASVVSVLSFTVAVGVGHGVAGLVSPVSSPYRAVADAVVRLAPGWLIELGKTLTLPGLGVGRADKVALLLGVGLVLLLVAVLAGLVSRASPTPGRWVLAAVGAVGLLAVRASPVFGPADLLAPLTSLVCGLASFGWLHRRASLEIRAARRRAPLEVRAADGAWHRAGESGGLDRRGMLVSGAAVGVGAVSAGVLGNLLGAGAEIGRSPAAVTPLPRLAPPTPAIPPGADFVADGTPSFLTSNADFYRIDTALSVPVQAATDWSMRIHGMVRRKMTVRYPDLLRRPLVTRTVTLTCVSNEVGGSLISTASFLGVDLRDLLLEVGVVPGAEQLLSTSLDGWTAGTPVDVVMEPDRGAMLALGMNGVALPLEHGYPVRMVVPGLYGYVSATKWLAELELTTFAAEQSYWSQRGWAREAPVKTESRIDKPTPYAQVSAGRVTMAGIAWAQHRGVRRVEVRVDGGPWRPAELATDVSKDTWRMWRAFLTVPPGEHTVESRATDGTGTPQDARAVDPVPNGASGYPKVQFIAV